MKLLPFLLYVVALGLFGLAGWTVYQMPPMGKTEERAAATWRGQVAALGALTRGRWQRQRSTTWVYSNEAEPGWAVFKAGEPDRQAAAAREGPHKIMLQVKKTTAHRQFCGALDTVCKKSASLSSCPTPLRAACLDVDARQVGTRE
jgi:hypothetical protein